ncbi:hypothetical protein Pint_24043 [Pistacia integerrima]|uniref:Uncharacterized protein n=1 Tax=Pistacia integerrima TaxID=434235 RepID=A0ACC0YLV3_9ROSI|nr:hypothetical protein Pint_24043 [Pistacia integerrima]
MGIIHFHLLLVLISVLGTDAAVLTLENRCKDAVWPGILAGSGKPLLNNGIDINAPPGWSGRLWGRTGYQFDPSGKGKCITGDCGGVLNCEGAGGEPPGITS